jgi:hypothetical protein
MSVSHNAGSVGRHLRGVAFLVAPELAAAAEEGAKVVEAAAVAVLEEKVYSIPEKVGPSGRRLWIRTGRLKAGESARRDGVAIEMRNRTPYARYRRDMKPTPPQLEVDWQREAAEKTRGRVLALRRAAVRRAMERGRTGR